MIYFILGLIAGMLIRDIKCFAQRVLEEAQKNLETGKTEKAGKAEFYEPISEKEKFEKAKNISENISVDNLK